MRPIQMLSRGKFTCSLSLQFCLNVVIAVVVIEMVVVLLSAIGLHLPHWVYASIGNFSIGWSSENLSATGFDPGIDESASSFLLRYNEFCKKNYLPTEKNVEHWYKEMSRSNSSEVCDCLPADLGNKVCFSFIHSFIHYRHLYSTSSRRSEALPTPAQPNKTSLS